MPKKNTTIEDLARMVKKGFDDTASKSDIKGLRSDIEELKSYVGELKLDVKDVKNRLDNIERLILKQHGERIINLERRMSRMEEMFAVK